MRPTGELVLVGPRDHECARLVSGGAEAPCPRVLRCSHDLVLQIMLEGLVDPADDYEPHLDMSVLSSLLLRVASDVAGWFAPHDARLPRVTLAAPPPDPGHVLHLEFGLKDGEALATLGLRRGSREAHVSVMRSLSTEEQRDRMVQVKNHVLAALKDALHAAAEQRPVRGGKCAALAQVVITQRTCR